MPHSPAPPSPVDEIFILPLGPEYFAELAAFWQWAHPFHPMTEALLRERLFGAGADPDLMLAARDGAGQLLGFAAGAALPEFPQYAGVRWLGVDPARHGTGIEARLLAELEARLKRRGQAKARLLATPPYYIRPGIDTRETALIAAVLDLGWRHEQTCFNMTVDLARWEAPTADEIFAPDARGYAVHRARPEDFAEFDAAMREAWTPNWRAEATQAFEHDPISLFLATRDDRIVGFAAYEVSQCLGAFGPTGVAPEHRGAALGRRLLWACLADLRALGRPVCEIGWVGPISFYWRAAGAVIGLVYWMLTKEL